MQEIELITYTLSDNYILDTKEFLAHIRVVKPGEKL